MITISKTHLTDIQEHGKGAFPYECCGALLGNVNADTQHRDLVKLIRIENQSDEDKRRRFSVTAEDYKMVEEEAKKEKLTLIGFYHTHPDHPAFPSTTDLEYAWPFFSYIIHSVQSGEPSDINSFELDLDKNEFKQEKLNIN